MENAASTNDERLTSIIAIQQEIAAAEPRLQGIMDLVTRRTQELTGASGAAIELAEDGGLLYRAVSGSATSHLGMWLGLDDSLSGQCFKNGEVLRSDDTEKDTRVNRELTRRVGIRSMVVVPLRYDREVVGVLKVLSGEREAFSSEDIHTLELMAGMIATAMRRSWEVEARQELLVERQHSEQALRQSEERYRILFDSIDEGFCIIEMIFDENDKPVDYRFLETNPAFERQTGLRNALGKTMRELEPDHEKHWFEIYGYVALSGEAVRFENSAEMLHRYFDVYAFRFGQPEDRQVAILFNNIIERKKAEEERERLLQEVETERQRLSEIFYQAPSLMCVLRTEEHVFERANELYLRLIGDRKVIGKPIRKALPEIEGQGFVELLDRVYHSGEPIIGTETPVMLNRSSGQPLETRYVDFVYQPMRETDGSISGVFVQGVDVTDHKRAEQALLEIREGERRRIARDLHDSVLQDISAASQTLQAIRAECSAKGQDYDKDLDQVLDAMRHAARGLRGAIHDLRQDEAKPLVQEIEALLELSRQLNPQCEFTLNVESGFPQELTETVSRELLRILREALLNVRRHSGARRANVTLGVSDREMRAVVFDDGRGFDQATASDGFGSSGMRERARGVGGTLEITSEPGKGTSVTTTMPIVCM
jgi:PAS domain S-box-containing protein